MMINRITSINIFTMNETRPRSSSSRWEIRRQTKSSILGIDENSTTVIDNSQTWNNSRTGSESPNWRQVVLAGGNATTTFVASRRFMKYSGHGRIVCELKPDDLFEKRLTIWTGDFPLVPSSHANIIVDEASAIEKAQRSVISRAKDLISPFQGGVFVGELSKTLRMIRNPLFSIREQTRAYFEKLKKVSPRYSSAQRARALSDTYLEYRFGVTPLFYDVQGAVKATKEFLTGHPFRIEKVTGKGKIKGSALSSNAASSGSVGVFYDIVDTKEFSYWIKAGIKVGAAASGDSVPASVGILPQSWLPTAWELLPYSFLIDYFANVGSIIDAVSLVNGNVAWACSTQRTTQRTALHVRENRAYSSSFGPLQTYSFSAPQPSLNTIGVIRAPVYALTPSLTFRIPGFGSTQSWNIAALLVSNGVKRPFF